MAQTNTRLQPITEAKYDRITLYLPRHRAKLLEQANAANMTPSAYVAALIDVANEYGWGIPQESDDDNV